MAYLLTTVGRLSYRCESSSDEAESVMTPVQKRRQLLDAMAAKKRLAGRRSRLRFSESSGDEEDEQDSYADDRKSG